MKKARELGGEASGKSTRISQTSAHPSVKNKAKPISLGSGRGRWGFKARGSAISFVSYVHCKDQVLSSHFADGETESQILFEICIFLQEVGYSSVVVYKGINPGIIGPNFCSLVLGCSLQLS